MCLAKRERVTQQRFHPSFRISFSRAPIVAKIYSQGATEIQEMPYSKFACQQRQACKRAEILRDTSLFFLELAGVVW